MKLDDVKRSLPRLLMSGEEEERSLPLGKRRGGGEEGVVADEGGEKWLESREGDAAATGGEKVAEPSSSERMNGAKPWKLPSPCVRAC